MRQATYQPPQIPRPYWTVGKILGLFLGLIILGGIAVFAVAQFRNVSQSGALPIVQVTVSGTAQKTGALTTPVRVEFGKCYWQNCVASCYSASTGCCEEDSDRVQPRRPRR